MYSQDLIEAVLKHADIVQIISSYIPVEKKGRSYVALCPFHDDKNPSMQISAEKQIFKCFVCGTGGNAIGFVEKYEKIPFAAAVRKVAQLCGYNDPRLVDDAPKVPVDPGLVRLHDCINDLQAYYRYALAIPEEAMKCSVFLKLCGRGREMIGIRWFFRGGSRSKTGQQSSTSPRSSRITSAVPMRPPISPARSRSPTEARRTLRMCSARRPAT